MQITENINKSNQIKTIQKIFSVFLALYPLLCIYKAFYRFTIGDVLLMAFLAIGIMRSQKIDFRVLSIGSFVSYTVFVFVLNLIFFKTMQLAAVLPYTLRLVKLIFYLLSAIISGRAFFNTKYFEKALFTTSVVVCVFLFIQYIMYYGTGTVVLGRIPGLTVYLQEYLELDYETIYSYSFRPSSLFLEPANFCQFMVVPLGLALFSKNTTGKKRMFYIIIFTLGMLLSTSAQGMLYLAVVYIAYFLRGTRKKSMAAMFITIAIIVALIMYSEVDVVKTAVDRLFNENAVDARFGSYSYLKTMEGIHIILGYGYGVVPEEEFLAGAAYIIYGCGMFGFAFACLMFYELYKRATGNKAKTVCFIFFVALFGTSIFYNYMLFWYITIILCVQDDEKTSLFNAKISRKSYKNYADENLLQSMSQGEIPSFEIDDFVIQQNRERYRQNEVFCQNVDERTGSKILFMLGMYHPQYSANGISCKNVIDECVNSGYDVSCVVNDYYGEKKEDVIDGAKIYRIKHRLFDRVIQWCDRNKGKSYVPVIKKFAYIVNKLKFLIMSPMWPFVAPLYSYRFYKKAKTLHCKEHFDTVVCVYTPFDAVMAGCMLKKKYPEIRFIPYYLDAFAGGWGPNVWSDEKRERRTRKWENFIDKNADLVISMASSRKYHEDNPLEMIEPYKRKFLDVPLMRDINKTENKDKETATKTLLFAGGLSYPRRDPRPILEVLSEVCVESDTEAIFLGECNKPSIFEPYCEKSGGKIKYLGQQPHSTVLEMGEKADCFINIGSRNPFTISGKIFEYMSFGKPIISTYYIENEPSKEYLEKYGFALLIDEKKDVEESANEVKKFLSEIGEKEFDSKILNDIFYENTPKAFVDLLRTEL